MKKLITMLFITFSMLMLVSCNLEDTISSFNINLGNTDVSFKSTYEIYKEKYGYEGSEEEWLDDLINGKLATNHHEHSFGEWINYNENSNKNCENIIFYRICESCNIIECKKGSYDTHLFKTITTNPTCQSSGYDTKICTICGKEEIVNEIPPRHVVDESGYCTKCSKPVAGTKGLFYDISSDGTYATVIGYEGLYTDIVIADTYSGLPVKTIHNGAFRNLSIMSIVIPDSVISIESAAFEFCGNLTRVIIGSNVECIGDNAFYACQALRSIEIGNSLTSIGSCAFFDCLGLESITLPDSITCIGSGAFEGSALKSITIPNSVTSDIDSRTFARCYSLRNIIIGNGVARIEDYAFYDSLCLESIVIGHGVISIGKNLFDYLVSPNIKYRGTEDQWNTITKASEWDNHNKNYSITYNYDGK